MAPMLASLARRLVEDKQYQSICLKPLSIVNAGLICQRILRCLCHFKFAQAIDVQDFDLNQTRSVQEDGMTRDPVTDNAPHNPLDG